MSGARRRSARLPAQDELAMPAPSNLPARPGLPPAGPRSARQRQSVLLDGYPSLVAQRHRQSIYGVENVPAQTSDEAHPVFTRAVRGQIVDYLRREVRCDQLKDEYRL